MEPPMDGWPFVSLAPLHHIQSEKRSDSPGIEIRCSLVTFGSLGKPPQIPPNLLFFSLVVSLGPIHCAGSSIYSAPPSNSVDCASSHSTEEELKKKTAQCRGDQCVCRTIEI